jgi:acyl-CoA thioesterase-1
LRTFLNLIEQQLVSGCFLILLLIGCSQEPSPTAKTPSASPPRDGIGQRLGTDVTAQPGRSSIQPSAEQPRIVAFGDSLTAGLGVGSDEAYPAQLQHRLEMQGYRYRVINAGVSGETTAGGLRRVSWVLQSRPELVILELGGNDGLRGLSVEETKSNLDQIIRRLQEAQVTVVLAGMKLPPNYGVDYRTQFETIYQELASRYQLRLIPFFLDGVADSTALNQADGIHPTAEGYRIIVDRIFPALTAVLDEQGRRVAKRTIRNTDPRAQ